jgi:hypothetical protein
MCLHGLVTSVMDPEASWQGAGAGSCRCLGYEVGKTSGQVDRGSRCRMLPPGRLDG